MLKAILKWLNPFDGLVETNYSWGSRTLRTGLKQKLKDTYWVLAGTPDFEAVREYGIRASNSVFKTKYEEKPYPTSHWGIIDYLSLGLMRLCDNSIFTLLVIIRGAFTGEIRSRAPLASVVIGLLAGLATLLMAPFFIVSSAIRYFGALVLTGLAFAPVFVVNFFSTLRAIAYFNMLDELSADQSENGAPITRGSLENSLANRDFQIAYNQCDDNYSLKIGDIGENGEVSHYNVVPVYLNQRCLANLKQQRALQALFTLNISGFTQTQEELELKRCEEASKKIAEASGEKVEPPSSDGDSTDQNTDTLSSEPKNKAFDPTQKQNVFHSFCNFFGVLAEGQEAGEKIPKKYGYLTQLKS